MEERVVVVDDDVIILKSANRVLSECGMRVTCLKSGRLLMDYIEMNVVDMLLLDIRMPDLDGFETLSLLREWEQKNGKPETPVVFFTATITRLDSLVDVLVADDDAFVFTTQ